MPSLCPPNTSAQERHHKECKEKPNCCNSHRASKQLAGCCRLHTALSPACFLSGRLPICLQTTSLIGAGKHFDFKMHVTPGRQRSGGRGEEAGWRPRALSRSGLPAWSCPGKEESVAAGQLTGAQCVALALLSEGGFLVTFRWITRPLLQEINK